MCTQANNSEDKEDLDFNMCKHAYGRVYVPYNEEGND